MKNAQTNMTRVDVFAEVANRTGVSKNIVRDVIETFIEVIKESIRRRFTVTFRGFGSFDVKKRAAKKARNISKNISIEIPEHEVPTFKPSREWIKEIKNS